nr:T9SS type A sorting domain-containing protein [uncultured Psychroserpens sp.]
MKNEKLLIITVVYFIVSIGTNLYAQNFTETIITKSNQWITPTYVDFDGDSDIDVISSSNGGDIAWWENDGNLNFTKQELVTTSSTWRHFDVIDLDADGDLDILLLEISSIRIFYNDGNHNFNEINIGSNFNSTNIIAGNFDADSDIEFITSEGNNNGRLRLWNTQGNGFFSATLVDNIRIFSTGSMLAEDLDSDGDLDIIASLRIVPSGSNSLFYYINDGSGVFSKQSIAYTNGNYLNQIVDYNNDGHKDILVKNTFNCCATIFVNDGSLNFSEVELISGASALEYSFFVDSDNDGDQDIVTVHADPIDSNPERYVGLYENDGNDNFSFQIIAPLQKGNYITSLDITGDGLVELLVGSEASNHPVVFENMDSNSYAPIELDDTFVPNMFDINDIDNDGLKDIISVSQSKNELVLWKNNGSYTFTKQVIEQNEIHLNSAQIVDVNGDQIKDILVVTYVLGEQKIILYQNDGNLSFTKHLLRSSNNLIGAPILFIRDRDLDGDPDIIFNSSPSDGVICLQNDGNNNYTTVFISDEEFRLLVFKRIDINNDGFDDLITDSDIYYLNDGQGNYSIANLPVDGVLTDLDGDNDVDIVNVQVLSSGQYISWFENDGSGVFSENIISDPYRGRNAVVRDFDGDGDIDIVTAPFNDFNSQGLILWKNNGNQVFSKITIEDMYYIDSSTLYQADLDGDGDIEILSSNAKFPFTIWNNESNVPLNVESVDNNNTVMVYPTIADTQLNIITYMTIIDAIIYDIHGKVVDVQIEGSIIDVSHLSNGIYILKLSLDTNETQALKFIKK